MQGSAYFMRAIEIATLHAKSIFQNSILSFKKHAWKNKFLFSLKPPYVNEMKWSHPWHAVDRWHTPFLEWLTAMTHLELKTEHTEFLRSE